MRASRYRSGSPQSEEGLTRVDFYGYPRCRTCRSVEAALRAAGVEARYIDITKSPPSPKVLERMVERYGPGGVVRWGKREAERIARERGVHELIRVIRIDPARLVRPVVVSAHEVLAGRDALSLLRRGRPRGGAE